MGTTQMYPNNDILILFAVKTNKKSIKRIIFCLPSLNLETLKLIFINILLSMF